MEEKQWFWEAEGERRGPISESELRAKREAGELSGETLVWTEGMAEWISYDSSPLEKSKRPPQLPLRSRTAGTVAPARGDSPVLAAAAPTRAQEPIRTPRPNPNFRPEFRRSLARAWDLWKTDFWPFLGLSALVGILYGVVMQLYVTVFFLTFPIMVGLYWYVLKRKRGRIGSIDDLFFGFKRRFGDLAILNLVVAVPMILVTLLLLAIPIGIIIFGSLDGGNPSDAMVIGTLVSGAVVGFVVALLYSAVHAVAGFASLLIIDCDLPWKEAWKMAWETSKPRLGRLTFVYLGLTLLPFLGLFAFYFGAFFLTCWASIALVYLYEDAFGELEASRG